MDEIEIRRLGRDHSGSTRKFSVVAILNACEFSSRLGADPREVLQ
jgi:hypothetical protein